MTKPDPRQVIINLVIQKKKALIQKKNALYTQPKTYRDGQGY